MAMEPEHVRPVAPANVNLGVPGVTLERDLHTDEMILSMGPQHPSTHGVLRVQLTCDGEIVTSATPFIGYLHRCAEKEAENLTYIQYVPYTDRMDYLASMNNNFGFVLAAESLMEIEVPPRAQLLRIIIAELNRIASHLLAFGTYGIDLGAFTPFLYGFRERETILDLFELACGARLTYNYLRIGGVARDIPPGWEDQCLAFLDQFEKAWEDYNNLLSFNEIFIKRAANIGVLSPAMALAYGCTGPMLRGSGISWDLRRDMPYAGYDRFSFDVPVGKGDKGTVGDCWDRYWVRMLEMKESAKIIRQALPLLAPGPHIAPMKTAPRAVKGEGYGAIENPRGELAFYILSEGGKSPYRVRARSPAYCNLSAIGEMMKGQMIGDAVAILGSIDIVLGEVDR